MSIRHLARGIGNVAARRIDDLDRRAGMAFVRLGLTDDADHACAAPARDLRRRLTHLAVDAHDEDDLAGLREAGAGKAFGRGHEGHTDSRCFLHRHVLRLYDQRLRLDDKMARMRAVAADAEIARRAEDFRADKFARPVDDAARKIAAGRARKDGIGHHAHSRFHVGGIDARSGDLDQRVFIAFAREPQGSDLRIKRIRLRRFCVEPQNARVDACFRGRARGDVHSFRPPCACPRPATTVRASRAPRSAWRSVRRAFRRGRAPSQPSARSIRRARRG